MIDIDTLLTWGAAYKKVQAGEIIFLEGSESHFYYQLVSGSARWINVNDEGKEYLQGIISPGEAFGLLPLFDEGKFAATAIANTACVILRLYKASFLQLIKENPEIHFQFSKLLTEKLRFKLMLIKEVAGHHPEHSISVLLNYFKDNKTNVCGECNKVNLTRQQIADMTGFRVETVIRAIRSMEQKGVLVIDKGKVYF